jgi:hypothetical protein
MRLLKLVATSVAFVAGAAAALIMLVLSNVKTADAAWMLAFIPIGGVLLAVVTWRSFPAERPETPRVISGTPALWRSSFRRRYFGVAACAVALVTLEATFRSMGSGFLPLAGAGAVLIAVPMIIFALWRCPACGAPFPLWTWFLVRTCRICGTHHALREPRA